jgi:hypothetical protein
MTPVSARRPRHLLDRACDRNTSLDADNENPDPSGDGRFVSMQTLISNVRGVVVRDTCLGADGTNCAPETRLVSFNRLGNPAAAGSGPISGDGRAVAFVSQTSSLLPTSTGTLPDVFLAQTGFTPTRRARAQRARPRLRRMRGRGSSRSGSKAIPVICS